ncbi:hypothetical protein OG828_31975 [Streptomyces sp. NBC_00457]|uniref:hypothetical protein n=1 Tax=Streptomyces sp. NBC_00457 TaxID=2975748 RepID=UPI002E21138A
MRGVYVLHGDAGVDAEDAEDADEVDRVGGRLGLVQDAVGPYLPWQQPDLVERGPHRAVADLRGSRVPVGLRSDEQVRVGGLGPVAAALARPVGHEGGAQIVEVDNMSVLAPAHRQGPAGEVVVGQVEPGDDLYGARIWVGRSGSAIGGPPPCRHRQHRRRTSGQSAFGAFALLVVLAAAFTWIDVPGEFATPTLLARRRCRCVAATGPVASLRDMSSGSVRYVQSACPAGRPAK